MNTAEKKIDLITWLASINDTEILDQLDEIRKKVMVENYQNLLEPMSMKELEDSVSEAEIDFKMGKFISQEELLKRIKEGKIL
jgi:hypothetical protein